MDRFDQAEAAWAVAWRRAPTAPPLVSQPLTAQDNGMALLEEASARMPPTPLPRPFQTPARIEPVPFYDDPLAALTTPGEQGVRLRFQSLTLSSQTQWLTPGDTLGAWLFVGHYVYPPPPEVAQGEDLRLLCLLDAHQVPFLLDGTANDVHTFHMGPNEERAWGLEFPNLPYGVHSLFCLLYIDPDAFPGPPGNVERFTGWLQMAELSYVTAPQLLFVGEEGQPEISYTVLPGTLPAEAGASRRIMVNRSAAEEDTWRHPWPTTWEGGSPVAWGPVEAAPGERVEFVLRANNSDAAPYRFGVVAFLDYRQVPLRVEDASPVSWYELPAGRQEVIPLSFLAPVEPGPHIYFVAEIQNPYEPAALYEWAGDAVRFPWLPLDPGDGRIVGINVPNMDPEKVSTFFDRIPLLVR
jgi:hypothetical protein